jgi:M6 family metalloprotease-like protein
MGLAVAAMSAVVVLVVVSGVTAGSKVYPLKLAVDTAAKARSAPELPSCLTSEIPAESPLKLNRRGKFSLPDKALSLADPDTIHCLVLRYNFQYETTDNPNTTGRGQMVLTNPLATPVDSANYYNAVGHWIDPPPHDSLYFDAHMRALNRFYESMSEGRLVLTWDIYPPKRDSVYLLPQPMSYYGNCTFDSVVVGLENYFYDCIRIADSASPEIDFSQYESVFLFHAGSDRQNDLGFPTTCEDLFTGFIRIANPVAVDSGARFVTSGLMMPETASQDNRATALNAVLAHEFGHQLGLPDIYDTRTFATHLGDFCMMDHNGFKTGVDFGFAAGSVFGILPVYPSAWCRAYLGFAEVYDFREGTDIGVIAATLASSSEIEIARIPISEHEYYLIENRHQYNNDNNIPAILADSATSVIQGPVNFNTLEFTGEYDVLAPGSGLAIYRVDESVAQFDYDGDELINFADNDLQWDVNRPFLMVVEGDGVHNLTGYCAPGCGYVYQLYGWEGDLYREDRQSSFTPQSNPPSLDHAGNNSRVRVTNIARDPNYSSFLPFGSKILFNVETDKLSSGFPVRVGYPHQRLSPIVDDLNGDGTDEIITAVDRKVCVITTEGESFLQLVDSCSLCPQYVDSSYTSIGAFGYVMPIYGTARADITCGPVAGVLRNANSKSRIAVGCANIISPNPPTFGVITIFDTIDSNDDGIVERTEKRTLKGVPQLITMGEILFSVVADFVGGFRIYHIDSLNSAIDATLHPDSLAGPLLHGIARIGNYVVVSEGDSSTTRLSFISTTDSAVASVAGIYEFGPVMTDMNADGIADAVLLSRDGSIAVFTVDTIGSNDGTVTLTMTRETGLQFKSAPSITVAPDGNPRILIGGPGKLYAIDNNGFLVSDFPVETDDRYPDAEVFLAPVTGDIAGSAEQEIIFSSFAGSVYAHGAEPVYGFPLNGGEFSSGSCVVFHDSTGGKFGYIGADGWFYSWDTENSDSSAVWPMYGHDPEGTNALLNLPAPTHSRETVNEKSYFSYPNPVTTGQTTIRYQLGANVSAAQFAIYDLSGVEIARFAGTHHEGTNEYAWDCGSVTPGVYRCMLEVKSMSGDNKKIFTDIAVIR